VIGADLQAAKNQNLKRALKELQLFR